MTTTNYFKVTRGRENLIFAFTGWARRSTRAAHSLATMALAYGGRLSVFLPVSFAGPWSDVPVIAPVEEPKPAPLYGVAGCF